MEVVVIAVICFLTAFIEMTVYKKLAMKGITYSLTISTAEAAEGDEIEIIEQITNGKGLPVPWLKAEIATSPYLEFMGTTVSENTRFVPSVFVLRPNQKCTRKWKVTCLKRGVFRFDDTTLVASDLLGLVTVSMRARVDAKITVLPKPAEVGEMQLSKEELFGNIFIKRFICPDPFEISGVREYTSRDSMSSIHWQSTARNQRLMVYNNEYTTSNNVLVALNMQRAEEGVLCCANMSHVEGFIRHCAFLFEECENKGMKISFASNGGFEEGVFLRERDVHSLLYALAKIEEICSVKFTEMLENISLSGYTDIIIVTPYISGRLVEFAERQRCENRNVVFCCADDTEIPFEVVPIKKSRNFLRLSDDKEAV